MKKDNSLISIAESNIKKMEERSFSLPTIKVVNDLNEGVVKSSSKMLFERKESFNMLNTTTNLDMSLQTISVLDRTSKLGGSILKVREEALRDLVDLQNV
jgi:hypothetical protein